MAVFCCLVIGGNLYVSHHNIQNVLKTTATYLIILVNMPSVNDLPHLIAAFNGLSVICLGFGYFFIRLGQWQKHRACMLGALAASAAFLIVYVAYKANSGFAKFGGSGWIRPVYFTILIVHVIGAIAIVPLVPITVYRALRRRFNEHRRIARWTWPLWMYVGISGIVVYVMAVHLYPYHG